MSSDIDPAAYDDDIGSVEIQEYGRISRRQVRRYARAVGDENELYLDVDAARERGYDDLVVPPNFLPAVIEPQGGAPTENLRRDGLDPAILPITLPESAILMGGGQDITVDRYLTAGEAVTERETFTDIYQKDADFGVLTFVERFLEYVGDGTDPAIECTSTIIVGDAP